MTTFRGQGGIIQILDNRISRRGLLKTFRRQNIELNMWKIAKKNCFNVAPKKRNNAQILLKSQERTQECWKCKIALQIRKSAKKSAQRNRDTGLIAFNLEKVGQLYFKFQSMSILAICCNRQQLTVLDSYFWNSIDANTTFSLRKVDIN